MTPLTMSPTLGTAIAAAGVVDAAIIGFPTTANATIQHAAPQQMRGRVTASWTTAFVGPTPIGLLDSSDRADPRHAGAGLVASSRCADYQAGTAGPQVTRELREPR